MGAYLPYLTDPAVDRQISDLMERTEALIKEGLDSASLKRAHSKYLWQMLKSLSAESSGDLEKSADRLDSFSRRVLYDDKLSSDFFILAQEMRTLARRFKSPRELNLMLSSLLCNMQAQRFTEQVAEYFRNRGFTTKINWRPVELHSSEIDVVCEKNGEAIEIHICECKMRYNGKFDEQEEVAKFGRKGIALMETQLEFGGDPFHFSMIMVCNLGFSDDIKHLAEAMNVKLFIAPLPTDWEYQPGWKVALVVEDGLDTHEEETA